MNKLEYFAAHAPEMPQWFLETGVVDHLQFEGNIFYEWRMTYAKHMILHTSKAAKEFAGEFPQIPLDDNSVIRQSIKEEIDMATTTLQTAAAAFAAQLQADSLAVNAQQLADLQAAVTAIQASEASDEDKLADAIAAITTITGSLTPSTSGTTTVGGTTGTAAGTGAAGDTTGAGTAGAGA